MNTKQDERMGTLPIGKLIVSMSVPAVAAQLINLLYNIIDRVYIGHIKDYGSLALTGVGVTFPIIMLISAFSALEERIIRVRKRFWVILQVCFWYFLWF